MNAGDSEIQLGSRAKFNMTRFNSTIKVHIQNITVK